MAFKNEHDAGYLSEPSFDLFWDDFGRVWRVFLEGNLFCI